MAGVRAHLYLIQAETKNSGMTSLTHCPTYSFVRCLMNQTLHKANDGANKMTMFAVN